MQANQKDAKTEPDSASGDALWGLVAVIVFGAAAFGAGWFAQLFLTHLRL